MIVDKGLAYGGYPDFHPAQDKNIRDLRAVKSACRVCTQSYTFPTIGKSNDVRLIALVSARHVALLNRGAHCTVTPVPCNTLE